MYVILPLKVRTIWFFMVSGIISTRSWQMWLGRTSWTVQQESCYRSVEVKPLHQTREQSRTWREQVNEVFKWTHLQYSRLLPSITGQDLNFQKTQHYHLQLKLTMSLSLYESIAFDMEVSWEVSKAYRHTWSIPHKNELHWNADEEKSSWLWIQRNITRSRLSTVSYTHLTLPTKA